VKLRQSNPVVNVRTVQCYCCHRYFDVPLKAISLSCPWCYRRVSLGDVVIDGECFTNSVRTCGRIVIERSGHLSARVIEGRLGVVVHGVAEGAVKTGVPLYVAPGGVVKGDVSAPALDVQAGGTIEGGVIRVGGCKPEVGAGVAASEERRAASGLGFDPGTARAEGEKLRVMVTLREARKAAVGAAARVRHRFSA